ncbi:MAG: hypothetical protein NTW49_12540 [Bacteroidia bacterium]|nr:hypothetical protein [Bacteroidia bacterium]
MLEKEFKYYVDHQDMLVEKYKGKHLVIIGENIVGVFSTFDEALYDSMKKYQPGTFLIQECQPGEDNFTQTFHTRAVFA